MKVLHFYKTYYPDSFGGVEQFINQLINGVKTYGIESKILSLSPNIIENFDNSSEGCYRAKSNFKIASTDFSYSVINKFKQLANDADLIHYHYPWPFMDVVHFITRINKPTVVSYHSDIIKQKKLLILYEPLMYKFLSEIDTIVVSSPNYFKSSKTLQTFKKKVEVIPFGLSNVRFSIEETRRIYWAKLLGKKFFFFVGVHRYYKGLKTLLQALKDSDFPTVIAGEGPMTNELKQLARNLNLKNLRFLGEISDEDKNAIFQLSYAFVFPSNMRSESFGISLLEAAMHGKPMITCEINTGTSFINKHLITGLVIPPDNINALHKAMNFIWNNDDVARGMGKEAYERYNSIFTAEKMCENYVSLYNKIIHQYI